jgi:lipopolysaccharide biosynthesis glycosyltransferase
LLATNSSKEFPRLAVAVRSVAESSSQVERLHFHLFLADHTEPDWWKLEKSWTDLQCEFSFHKAGDVLGDRSREKGYGYWYRIWAGEVLPPDVSRVLYLDCDTLTYDDVTRLWEIDLSHQLAAVVEDAGAPLHNFAVNLAEHAPRFGLSFSADQRYFNSGVLFINLDRWRSEGVAENLESIFQPHRGWAHSFDQDELNLLLRDRVKFISPAWNLIETLGVLADWKYAQFEQFGFPDYFEKPKIRHFAGGSKPEMFFSRSSVKRDYYAHLDRTHWSGQRSKWERWLIGWVAGDVMDLHYILVRGFAQHALVHPWKRLGLHLLRAPYSLPLYLLMPLNRLRLAFLRRCSAKGSTLSKVRRG